MATGETRLTLRNRIATLIPDASIANTDIESMIVSAHLVFPGTYHVDHTDETSVTIAASTYEYALPETSNVSTFVNIHRIEIEGDTAGVFNGGDLDLGRHVSIDYDGSGVWTLRLRKAVNDAIVAGRKLRISGQRKFVLPAADGDAIELHPGWVMAYTMFLLHQSRGGSSSDLAQWHQRMAGVFYKAAQDIEDNINNRAYPGAIVVPGVF